MKKLFLLILVMVLTTGFIFTASITVTKPVLNKRVTKGSLCSIKWTKTGTQDSNVKIKLFKSPSLTPVIDITSSTANVGSFSWQVPGNSETGKYTIRVTTLDNALFSYSKVFKIVKPGLKPGSLSGLKMIKVTKPVLNKLVKKGSLCSIKWIKTGTQDSNVKIKLCKSPSLAHVFDITSSTANDGSFCWQVPDTPGMGIGKYIIRVTTLDNALHSYSKMFRIVKPEPKQITVTQPILNKLVKKGSFCSIKWIKTGTQDSNVKIKLCKSPSLAHVIDISNSTANDGSYSWQVPDTPGMGIGKYIIRVTTLDNALHSYSKVFSIIKAEPKQITVTQPVLNKLIKKGSFCSIKWIKTGTQDSNVKIKLCTSPSLAHVIDISNSTANDGSYSWPVPNTPGMGIGKYIVRVTTLDNTLHSYSKMFRIVKPEPKPGLTEIKVTKPVLNKRVTKGGFCSIKWTKTGIQDSNVKIKLFKSPSLIPVIDITSSTANDGSFSWKVPGNSETGKYTIRVTTLDNALFSYSKVFKIVKPGLKPGSLSGLKVIKVTKPATNALVGYGSTYTIKWETLTKPGLHNRALEIQ